MNTWVIIPLVTYITYIFLFIWALPSMAKRINRLFAIYVAVAAAWSFTSYMLHINAFPQQARLWNELLSIAMIATLIAYYHFIRAYTNRPAGWGVYVGYALLVVFAVLCLKGYIVQYAYVVDGVLYHSLGISIFFIGAISLAFIGRLCGAVGRLGGISAVDNAESGEVDLVFL